MVAAIGGCKAGQHEERIMAGDFLSLDQPVTDGGIESIRFFNGRLLSGRDLTREQIARQSADALTGTAHGSGIAHGLEVRRTAVDLAAKGTVVSVRAGLAINAEGAHLSLANDQQLQLTRTDSSDFATGDCVFGECVIPETSSYVAGEGLYLLVIAPSRKAAGRAQVNGLPGDSASCNVDRDIEAVRFRLIEIPSALYAGMSALDNAFRNHIAYRCFGEGVQPGWPVNFMVGGPRGDDLISQMAAHGLTKADVPLAVIAFTGTMDINFLDCWMARRPLALADGRTEAGASIASSVAPRRISAGRAMLQQFQDHFAALTNGGATPGTVAARSHFPMLPPVGVLPKFGEANAKAFLRDMTFRGPVHINAVQVEMLLRESMACPAIRSSSDEVVWLYAVAENQINALRKAGDPLRSEPFYIFASGNIAYRADARFNLHRWNFANFALGG
jgi:hypothetical protein